MGESSAWRMYDLARQEILTKQTTLHTVLSWTVALFVAGIAAILVVNGQISAAWRVAADPFQLALLEWTALLAVAWVGLFQYVGEWAGILRASAYCFALEEYLMQGQTEPVAPWEHWLRSGQEWIGSSGWISGVAAAVLAVLCQAVPFLSVGGLTVDRWLLIWIVGAAVTLAAPVTLGFYAVHRRRVVEKAARTSGYAVEQAHRAERHDED